MRVSIHSLKRTLFQDEAVSLNCKTNNGEITILDHHRPLISVLSGGTLKVVGRDAKDFFFPITGGFVKVGSGNDVLLMVDEPVML